MSTSFIFRPHIYDANTITTPDVLVDSVYIADSGGKSLTVSPITNDRLTTSPEIQVLGYDTTAEAAVLLLAAGAGMLIGVASNHRYVHNSDPQIFAKPLSRQVWRFQHISNHWKDLSLLLIAGENNMIQDGKLSEFAPIDDIIPMIASGRPMLDQGTAVLCVGLPVLQIGQPSSTYNIKLISQEKDQVLELDYQVKNI